MDDADALAALENSTPTGEQAPAPIAPEVNQAPTPTPTAEQVESFTSIDPNTLSPENRALYNSMLADYTRKTQEIAPWRKTFEGVENPEEVLQAYEFYNNLNSDAEYAKTVYSQLGEALAPFMDNPNAEVPAFDPDDEVDPTVAKLTALEQKIQQFEEMQRFSAGAAELQRQEMALRSTHDNWTDTDFEAVYEIAQAYDGNLLQAGERYDALRNKVIADYLNDKAGVNPALAPVTTGLNASEPFEAPKDTAEAHTRAVEYLQQQLNGE